MKDRITLGPVFVALAFPAIARAQPQNFRTEPDGQVIPDGGPRYPEPA